jgi:hypothetical protein
MRCGEGAQIARRVCSSPARQPRRTETPLMRSPAGARSSTEIADKQNDCERRFGWRPDRSLRLPLQGGRHRSRVYPGSNADRLGAYSDVAAGAHGEDLTIGPRREEPRPR